MTTDWRSATMSLDLTKQAELAAVAKVAAGKDRILYELVGRDDRRISPYCWRIRYALAHKGLDAHFEPVRFTEKDKIAFSHQKLLPVLIDFGEVVTDSWDIAKYIEDNYYPERSLQLGGGTRFLSTWVDTQMHAAMVRVLVGDIYDHIHPDDRDYFRESRERRFGMTIAEMRDQREAFAAELNRVLAPLRDALRNRPYVSGKAPTYADYIIFSAFQWARCVSSYKLLDEDDPITKWKRRMIVLYESMANSVPHYE